MSDVTSSRIKSYWEKEYESTTTNFDVDEPDEWIAGLETSGRIRGRVLDAGCGPGRTALYLARLGYDVVGVDVSSNAIARANRKAAAQKLTAQFVASDVCLVDGLAACFDRVVDIGCFHSLPAANRPAYAAALHRMCRADAVIYLRAFSDHNRQHGLPSDEHSPFTSEAQLRGAFADSGWRIDDLAQREIDLLVSPPDTTVPASFWFAEIRRA